MSNKWCIRLTWKYYDKECCEKYLKVMPSFGSVHTGTEQLHSHFYVETDYNNKKLRNDLNRYKTKEKPPKGFKALSISELRTTTGQYYDYVCKKAESQEQYINNVELDYPTESDSKQVKKTSTKTLIENIEEDVGYDVTHTPYELGCKVYDWYVKRAKVLPNPVILRQVIFTVIARYEYRRNQEWDGKGPNQSRYVGRRETIVREALGSYY